MDDSASSTSRTNGGGGGAGSSAHETLSARIAAGCRIDAEEHHHQQQGRPAPSSSSSQPPPSALVPSSAGPGPSAQLRKKVVWECTHCEKACFPIRFESRCLCNHRSVRCRRMRVAFVGWGTGSHNTTPQRWH